MLVIFVGYPCTGKTTLCNHLLDNHILAIEASSFVKPLKEECIQKGICDLYTKYPKSIVAELITQQYGDMLNHAVVVGLRTVEELHYFQRNYPVKLISIFSSLHTCFIRNNKRPYREHYDTEEEFFHQRILPDNKLGLSILYTMAEETIQNEKISEELYLKNALDHVLRFVIA